MNLNLRCPKIFQITKMTLIINNYQDSCTQDAANRQVAEL